MKPTPEQMARAEKKLQEISKFAIRIVMFAAEEALASSPPVNPAVLPHTLVIACAESLDTLFNKTGTYDFLPAEKRVRLVDDIITTLISNLKARGFQTTFEEKLYPDAIILGRDPSEIN